VLDTVAHIRVLAAALALFCAAAGAAIGCVSSVECRQSPEPTGGQQCVGRGGPAEDLGTAAAAGVAWGTVGCRVNGCNLPYTCNDDTGLCERMRCSEGHSCPPAYECDYEEGRCE